MSCTADCNGTFGRLDHGWPPLRLCKDIDSSREIERPETPRGRWRADQLAQGEHAEAWPIGEGGQRSEYLEGSPPGGFLAVKEGKGRTRRDEGQNRAIG